MKNVNEKIIETKKWSYLCNDSSIKCPDSKWKKVRFKRYCNTSNWDFKSRTKNLLDVKCILDELNIPFYLTHGTLLGAYREKDWIQWDDDVEIDIFDEIFKKNYDKLCNKLINKGFIIRGRKIEIKKKKGEKFNLYRDKEKISIRGIYLDPDYEDDKYRLTNVFQYLKEFYDKPEFIEFKGAIFMAPGPIKEFLTYRYGDDWETAIDTYKTKADKKRTNRKSYALGVRRPGK